MTQEEKELLIKDLCARLPYKVRIKELDPLVELELYLTSVYKESVQLETPGGGIMACDITAIKPYLRPMSSMTDEEHEEYKAFQLRIKLAGIAFDDFISEYNDWLNGHHFDYRDLIYNGLALEAPEGMYNV